MRQVPPCKMVVSPVSPMRSMRSGFRFASTSSPRSTRNLLIFRSVGCRVTVTAATGSPYLSVITLPSLVGAVSDSVR